MEQNKIILISDPRVLQISIQEIGEALVDLKEYPQFVINDRKGLVSKSFSNVRKSVADKLLLANNLLPKGFKFLIVEGHRPISLQQKYFQDYSNELMLAHNDWDQVRVYQEASKYVAPPDIVPPHSTGGAIDLTLINEGGVELDMGCRLNADPEASGDRCFTSSIHISSQAKSNREILIKAMTTVGFINYPTEWWHWSYGDRYWAYCVGNNVALYNSIEYEK